MHTDKLSLHCDTWVDHAESLYLAGNENYKLFTSLITNSASDKRVLQNGVIRAMGLLFATAIGLIIKARILNAGENMYTPTLSTKSTSR